MSLESEIKNLTGAMTRLAEGVEKLLSISQPTTMSRDAKQDWLKSPPGTVAPESVKNPPTATIEAIAAEVLDAVAKQEIMLPAEVEHSIEVAQATAPPTFDDAKRAFLAIAQKYGAVEGTKLSKDVLSRYGVPNLKALSAEQYGDFIELCGTVVAGGAA